MKSNISKHFAAKAKQGLRNCFADGMVQLPDSEFIRTGMQTFAAQENAKVAEAQKAGVQYAGPTTTDMKDKMIEINNQSANPSYQFGLESPNGRGAQHQFANKSMSDLQSGNQPYMPGSANDPHASASIGPKGPTRLPQASPSRTALRSMSGGLRMAEGGMVPETAEQVMARMANKYGTTGAAQAAPVAQPAPAPVQATPPPVQPPKVGMSGLLGRAVGSLRGADERLRQATNFAEGGIVRGPGGPTDDEVPMTIGGTDVNLSNKEAVLPAKTVDALGGPEAVEALIEETNGKPPVSKGLRQGGEYASGDGGWGLGSGQKPTIYDNGGLPAPVVQAGIETMRGQLADTRAPSRMSSGSIRQVESFQPKEDPEAVMRRVAKTRGLDYVAPAAPTPVTTDTPTDPDTDGRRVYSTPTAPSFVNRGAAPAQPTLSAANYSNEGRSVPTAGSNPVSTVDRTLVDNTLGKDAAMPQGLRGRWAGNDPMKAQQFTSADNAANGLRNNPANGHGVVSIKQPDGSFKNVLMGPSEYTATDGSKTSDWSKTSQFAQGTAQAAKDKVSLRDLEYSNAKFNATSDQITDPNARAAGLRGLAQYDVEEKQKAETAKNAASAESARIGHLLTERGQNITLRGQDNMQKNSERDFKQGVSEKVNKRVEEMLNLHAPTTGLKDDALPAAQARRADMQEAMYSMFGKNMPQDDATLNKAMPQLMAQAKTSLAIRDAIKNRGMWNKISNIGRDPWTTLHAAKLSEDGTSVRFPNGFTISIDDIVKDGNAKSADIYAALQSRTK